MYGRLALALLLSGCAAMARDLERAKADGSLACAYVLAKQPGVHPFDVACRYDSRARVCTCTAEGFRFDRPVLSALPAEYVFRPNVCGWLPDDLTWPPSPEFARMLADIESARHESAPR